MELLQRVYSQQEGTVLTDRERRLSDQTRHETRRSIIERDVNAVLQFSLEDDLKRWKDQQKSIRLNDRKKTA